MDSRIDVFDLFGLAVGDAHVIRNAGGIVNARRAAFARALAARAADPRSAARPSYELRLQQIREDDIQAQLLAEVGEAPPYGFGTFEDVDDAVREALKRVREYPFLPHRDRVRGFVYDVESGILHQVG